MSSSLRGKLDELASSFANDVLHAIRSASIEDLLAETTGGGHRVASRGAARKVSSPRPRAPPHRPPAGVAAGVVSLGARRVTIAGVVDRIVGLLEASPKGLRAEQIRQKLGFQSKELPRPLKEAVDAGRLGKSGQKRATTYFVKGGRPPSCRRGQGTGTRQEAREEGREEAREERSNAHLGAVGRPVVNRAPSHA